VPGRVLKQLRVTSYGLRVTGYGLRVTGYGLRVTGYGLRVTGYEYEITGLGFHYADALRVLHYDYSANGSRRSLLRVVPI
jgi:hypothetical protein